MMELKVDLEFQCCTCHEAINVTVKCSGKAQSLTGRTVTSVNVPCPSCGNVNKLYFEPNGTVRTVSPFLGPLQVPEPSVN